MNYRHDYHAGNFADVVKHILLARVVSYLKLKSRPFRVIDTHAGSGCYDLQASEAEKTGEWQDGVARLFDAALPDAVAALVAPYLSAVRAVNPDGGLRYYPGSPLIARHLMRRDDVLVANELHPEDFARLTVALRPAPSTVALNIDAWHAVKSLLPPKERRGVVLIDPPFEEKSEFAHMAAGLTDATARFATGVYLIWYPLKDENAADRFVAETVARTKLEWLEVRLAVRRPFPGLGLTAVGLLLLNPPHVMRAELETLLPVLRNLLQQGEGADFQVRDQL